MKTGMKLCVLIGVAFCLFSFVCFSCGSERKISTSESSENELKYAERLRMWKDSTGVQFAQVLDGNKSSSVINTYIFPEPNKMEEYKSRFPNAVILPASGSRNLMVYSSVFSSILDEMGTFSSIGSVADADYFTDSKIKDGLKNGNLVDMGLSQNISEELLISHKPSLALVNLYDGVNVSALDKHSVPVAYMAENLEETPLGRAEWIKFIACIAGHPEMGDSIFRQVERDYLNLKNQASGFPNKPRIMVENMYQGVWYVPGGKSYAAHLIADAGGDYLWKDNNDIGSLSLTFENVLDKASDADIWLLKLFGQELTSQSLKAMDERNMLFGPVKKGNVWYSNTATSRLYDETPYHPELLLKDYIEIFHPTIDTDGSPKYFSRMKQ